MMQARRYHQEIMRIKSISRLFAFTVCLLVLSNQASTGQFQLPAGSHTTPTKDEARYQKWLDEDVVYIITDEEKAKFVELTTTQERDTFIVNFWERRNPNPGSGSNPFKEEHYRRLAYVNEHFASHVPGWKTDRGRIYIFYGPPDERETHPASSGRNLPPEAPETARYPTDIWRYQHIAGLGRDVMFVFVDRCRCGNYELVDDPTKKLRPKGENTSI